MRQLYVVPRRRLLLAAWLTALALPILVIDNIPKTEARAQASVEVIAPADLAPVTSAPATTAAPTTAAPTTAPPTTAAPATTAPARKAAATLVTPSTTKTAAARPTTTTAPAPTTTAAPANTQEGGASWYDYNPGECAHQTIPKGTVVTVTNLATGASTTCTVTDRGPYGAGRIIDLDRSTFAQLADPSAGVIQVRITW